MHWLVSGIARLVGEGRQQILSLSIICLVYTVYHMFIEPKVMLRIVLSETQDKIQKQMTSYLIRRTKASHLEIFVIFLLMTDYLFSNLLPLFFHNLIRFFEPHVGVVGSSWGIIKNNM